MRLSGWGRFYCHINDIPFTDDEVKLATALLLSEVDQPDGKQAQPHEYLVEKDEVPQEVNFTSDMLECCPG